MYDQKTQDKHIKRETDCKFLRLLGQGIEMILGHFLSMTFKRPTPNQNSPSITNRRAVPLPNGSFLVQPSRSFTKKECRTTPLQIIHCTLISDTKISITTLLYITYMPSPSTSQHIKLRSHNGFVYIFDGFSS